MIVNRNSSAQEVRLKEELNGLSSNLSPQHVRDLRTLQACRNDFLDNCS
jgi:hypothetical protein